MRFALMSEPQQGLTYDEILALVHAAEDAGFEAYFRSDHYASFPGGSGSHAFYFLDPDGNRFELTSYEYLEIETDRARREEIFARLLAGEAQVRNLPEKYRARIRDVRVGPGGALFILTDEDDGELLELVPPGA